MRPGDLFWLTLAFKFKELTFSITNVKITTFLPFKTKKVVYYISSAQKAYYVLTLIKVEGLVGRDNSQLIK